ncbi:hypothetical protein MKY84_13590 [Chryseomicrobium sp. FSL W7-1435]|uniref:hypothetical protein n=1 Tax=Chryseomicrobium sp. FSL W7-1435 TaxID=2921704 RepID=UPI00315ACFCF
MKAKVKLLLLLTVVLLIMGGCVKVEALPEFEMYEKSSLHIAVIGEKPVVREKNIEFTSITFDDLQNVEEYDAVFITKENLEEADQPEYASIYTSSSRPFLFIGTTKSYVPFVDEEISLDEFPDVESGMYAYLYDQSSEQYWGYGLYNDIVNEKTIQEAYSRIFKTIEELSM